MLLIILRLPLKCLLIDLSPLLAPCVELIPVLFLYFELYRFTIQVYLMKLFFLDVEKLLWHLLLQRFRSKERKNVWRKQECVLSSAGNYQWLKRNGRGKRGDIFYDLFSVSVGKTWLETVLYFLTLIFYRSFDMNVLDKQSCDSLTYMYQQFAQFMYAILWDEAHSKYNHFKFKTI